MITPETSVTVPLEDVEKLDFPCYFTATFDYFATGEGVTVAVFMGHATSALELRSTLEQQFGAYFNRGAQIWQGLQVPESIEAYVPDAVKQLCSEKRNVGNFRFFSSFHMNLS